MATTPSFILTTLQSHKHSGLWLHSVLQITFDLAPSGRWLMKIPAWSMARNTTIATSCSCPPRSLEEEGGPPSHQDEHQACLCAYGWCGWMSQHQVMVYDESAVVLCAKFAHCQMIGDIIISSEKHCSHGALPSRHISSICTVVVRSRLRRRV